MRVLHAYNRHRGLGGSDMATLATVGVLRERGIEVDEFVRDSRDLAPTLGGKASAFVGGIYAAGAVREFEALLRERRPDAVHVHELYPLISPWILPVCERAGIGVVMSCSDFRLSCPIATHYTRGAECLKCVGGHEYWCVLRNCRSNVLESVAYALRNASARHFELFTRHVHRYVVASEYQREFLTARAGIDSDRVVVNYCAINLPPEAAADPAQGGYVGFAGRFAPEKGVEVMVQACRLAGLPMRFAGDAPGHPAVRPDDDATFVMTQSPAELAEFYRNARVIVVPSLWPETFGIVAAEAMSHGIPVVASRLGALQATVCDGETGLLAQPGDAADLAEKIRAIWDQPALARRLGANARKRAQSQFSRQAHFDRLLPIYADVMAEVASGRLRALAS